MKSKWFLIAGAAVLVVAVLIGLKVADDAQKRSALQLLSGVYVSSADTSGDSDFIVIDGAKIYQSNTCLVALKNFEEDFAEKASAFHSFDHKAGIISMDTYDVVTYKIRNWRTSDAYVLVDRDGNEYSHTSTNPRDAAKIYSDETDKFNKQMEAAKTQCSFCDNPAVTYETDGARRCAVHQVKASSGAGGSSGSSGGSGSYGSVGGGSSSYGSGSSSDWETNAKSATRKLLQGRTDLTQDEYDAYKQSEAQYDATH